MPYLIDGHNLIPRVRGLNLTQFDDEMRLIELLQDYCRMRRCRVEVYFDNAAVGYSGVRRYGSVQAHFIPQGKTADVAIVARLRRLGGEARNWTVVSSDQEIRAAAETAQARLMNSEDFAGQMVARQQTEQHRNRSIPPLMTEAEIEEWLNLFGVEPDLDE